MGRASSELGPELSARDLILIAVAALVGLGAYLLASMLTYRLGYPLDDSWIHATFARNLAESHEWAFRLGEPSAGSTAPFWTFLLAPGFWLGLAPFWWSTLLGYLTLVGLALVTESMTRRLISSYRPRIPWVGLFMTFEWHMLWAAASGMETLLHALLTTIILTMLVSGTRQRAALGILTGLSVWVRPDGLTLAAPVIAVILYSDQDRGRRVRSLTSYSLAFAALLIPYLAFNLWLSGAPMPNTFYAKQAEYAAWQARPLLERMGLGLVQISTGPFIILWPGLALTVARIIRTRDVALGVALLWCALYGVMYMLRLPAYQHGRYLMPVMPMLFVAGMLGYLEFRDSNLLGKSHWVVAFAWQSGLVLLSLGFLGLGARAYGEDVALIESEMVNTAIWVAQEIPPDAVIAAHDIGALGYFDHHTLIDLAGLVSPEVVPFLRDEDRLAEFLDRHGADYLIAFPKLYPELAASSEAMHSSGGSFARAVGEGNLTVYCWRCH